MSLTVDDCERIISEERWKWAIHSFEPYNSVTPFSIISQSTEIAIHVEVGCLVENNSRNGNSHV